MIWLRVGHQRANLEDDPEYQQHPGGKAATAGADLHRHGKQLWVGVIQERIHKPSKSLFRPQGDVEWC